MKILAYLEAEYWRVNLWNVAFFIFGIVCYFALKEEPSWMIVNASVGMALVTLRIRNYGVLGMLFSGIIVSFCLGVLAGKVRTSRIDTVALRDPVVTEIKGRVTSIKYTVKAMQIILDNVQFGTLLLQDRDPTKIRVTIPVTNQKNLMIGDYIEARVSLSPPSRSIIPGGYDFGLFSYFSGVGATGFALSPLEHIQAESQESTIRHYVHKMRKHIYLRLTGIMGRDEGNFAAALLIGEASGLNRNIMQDMRYSGLAHVLCVSGLHLSLVAGIFFMAFRIILNLSDKIAFNFNIKVIAAIISLFGSGIYLLLSGGQIAATRAYIMTSLFMIAIALGKTPYPLRSLGVAAILILIINPEYILHPSFQLSFAAVLALIGGYEFYLRNKWILGESHGIFAKIKLFIFSNIYSSILASLATTPIVIYHFYTVANYTIVANLLVVPLISFIVMPLGVISLILLPFGLDAYTLSIMGKIISKIIMIANWTAHLPGAVWHVGYITPTSLVIYIFGLFWVMLWSSSLRIYGLLFIVGSIIAMVQAPKPDVMLDANSQILGVKNREDQLEIYAPKISPFTKDYWNNWFGQKEGIIHKENIALKDHIIKTSSDKKVEIAFLHTKCEGDFVLNLTSTSTCSWQLSKDTLEAVGTVLVFCNKERCWAKYSDIGRFVFK